MSNLQDVDVGLRKYIESNIFKEYDKNEEGHKLDHIYYVIERSFKFMSQFEDVDVNMVYVVAAFHDIGHHIDRKNHEVVSAKVFYEDEFMKKYFDENSRIVIKEAIEDHRASLKNTPRSVYGMIVSSADRSTDVINFFKRTHSYTLNHFPKMSVDEMINRAYLHFKSKYGKGGYANIYVYDEEYQKFLQEVEDLILCKEKFTKKYLEVNYNECKR